MVHSLWFYICDMRYLCGSFFSCTPSRFNNGSALCSLSITFHYVIDIHSLYRTNRWFDGVDYCQIFPILWKCVQSNSIDSTAITGFFFSVQTSGFLFVRKCYQPTRTFHNLARFIRYSRSYHLHFLFEIQNVWSDKNVKWCSRHIFFGK